MALADFTGLIIEGVAGSGKSSVFKSLMQSEFVENNKDLSLIFLNEFQTQRILETKFKKNELTKSDCISLLNSHIEYFKCLREKLLSSEWCNKSQNGHKVIVVMERFHLSHLFMYPQLGWNDLSAIDEELNDLNFSIAALFYSKDLFIRRLIEDRQDNKYWLNYIRKFDKTDIEIIEHFFDQQKGFLESVNRSQCRKLLLDTSNKSTNETTNELLEFWNI